MLGLDSRAAANHNSTPRARMGEGAKRPRVSARLRQLMKHVLNSCVVTPALATWVSLLSDVRTLDPWRRCGRDDFWLSCYLHSGPAVLWHGRGLVSRTSWAIMHSWSLFCRLPRYYVLRLGRLSLALSPATVWLRAAAMDDGAAEQHGVLARTRRLPTTSKGYARSFACVA